jgi:hypothetical protein
LPSAVVVVASVACASVVGIEDYTFVDGGRDGSTRPDVTLASSGASSSGGAGTSSSSGAGTSSSSTASTSGSTGTGAATSSSTGLSTDSATSATSATGTIGLPSSGATASASSGYQTIDAAACASSCAAPSLVVSGPDIYHGSTCCGAGTTPAPSCGTQAGAATPVVVYEWKNVPAMQFGLAVSNGFAVEMMLSGCGPSFDFLCAAPENQFELGGGAAEAYFAIQSTTGSCGSFDFQICPGSNLGCTIP